MNRPSIPNDDITDVMEMTEKLETCFFEILKGNDKNLAMSALIAATLNITISECGNIERLIMFRNYFLKVFDKAIKDITNRY